MSDPLPDVTTLLCAWRGGDEHALGRLMPLVDDGHLMAARVAMGTTVATAAPVRLFDVDSDSYAVDPGGKRFLVLVPKSRESQSVKVTLNWSGTRHK